jgi:hypothetical protein
MNVQVASHQARLHSIGFLLLKEPLRFDFITAVRDGELMKGKETFDDVGEAPRSCQRHSNVR